MKSLRRRFLSSLLTVVAGTVFSSVPARVVADDYWFVVNEDNDHFFKCPAEEMTEAGLVRYADYVLRGKVTHFFMCVNGQRTSFDSKTWEPIWAGLNDPARKDTATRADGTHDRWAVNAKALADKGIDPYAVWIRRCREKGVSPWISMRMNDVHYANITNFFRNTTFYKNHPEWRLKADSEVWADWELNYAVREVRDYTMAQVREIAERWDSDGLELDWMRFAHVFRDGEERKNAPILDAFVREVRQALDAAGKAHGRRMGLAVHVMHDPDLAEQLGFNVRKWAREGLVDVVIPDDFNQPCPQMPIGKWLRGLEGTKARLVPGTGYGWFPREIAYADRPAAYRFLSDRFARQGARGVYTFNVPYYSNKLYSTDTDFSKLTGGDPRSTLDIAATLYTEGLAPADIANRAKFPFEGAFSGWSYGCDFSVKDEGGFPYSVNVGRRSAHTHRHGRIREDGRYAILLAGNRHFVPSPATENFVLKAKGRVELDHADRWEFSVLFRHDGETDCGNELKVAREKKKVGQESRSTADDGSDFLYRLVLDGREIATAPAPSLSTLNSQLSTPLEPFDLWLRVEGERGHVKVFGIDAEFAVAGKRPKGGVGFDIGPWHAHFAYKVAFDSLSISADASPETAERKEFRMSLGGEQGVTDPLVYDVTLRTFTDGLTEIRARLSGGAIGRADRRDIGSGSIQYLGPWDRVTDPYVRIDTPEGEWRNILLWNGTKLLYDREMHKREWSPSNWHRDIPWPREVRMLVRDFPKTYTVAAGFGHLQSKPLRFCEDGPFEKIVDRSGRELWRGRSLRRAGIGLSVKSPADKKLVSKIPANVWNREGALKHAREQHYFYPDEDIRFTVESVWHAAERSDAETDPHPRFSGFLDQDVGAAKRGAPRFDNFGMGLRRRTEEIRLDRHLPTGVYKFLLDRADGTVETVIFEVLSEDPKVSPPVASGLPFLMEMANEMRFNEHSAFDPWSDHGGYSHCYTAISRYPKIAEDQRIWELLPVYGRKWMHWGQDRVQSDLDMYSDWNRKLIAKADFFGGCDNRVRGRIRYDLCKTYAYVDDVMDFLIQFAETRRPAFKVITVEELKRKKAARMKLSKEEFHDLFETAWEEWCRFARPRIDASARTFIDYLWSVNPNVARVSYGPTPLYVSHYWTAYALKYSGFSVDEDPRLRATGAYWQLESYPSWCDYPDYVGNMFVATYGLYHGKRGPKIYPELNGPIHEYCADDSVTHALPEFHGDLANTHHRKNVYWYAYATGYFRDGKYGFWTDDGYHYQFPERGDLDEVFHAWKLMKAHRPVAAAKAPFIVLDRDELARHGEYMDVNDTVCNAAEQGLAWAYEALVTDGWNTPVFTDYAELDHLTKENCECLLLPPLCRDTPQAVRAKIDRAKARGIPCVFIDFDPVRKKKASFTCGDYRFGTPSLDREQVKAFQKRMRGLVAKPFVRAEDGLVTATYDAAGNLVVILSDAPPLHGDARTYPYSFRFEIRAKGIGAKTIEADTAYTLVERESDRLVIRLARPRDTALFFCFKQQP